MDTKEVARLTGIKASIVQTTNTQGWRYIQQIADNIVRKTTDEALEEEDREKGESKRLKAGALKKGFAELFYAVNTTAQLDLRPTDNSGLEDLETQ